MALDAIGAVRFPPGVQKSACTRKGEKLFAVPRTSLALGLRRPWSDAQAPSDRERVAPVQQWLAAGTRCRGGWTTKSLVRGRLAAMTTRPTACLESADYPM